MHGHSVTHLSLSLSLCKLLACLHLASGEDGETCSIIVSLYILFLPKALGCLPAFVSASPLSDWVATSSSHSRSTYNKYTSIYDTYSRYYKPIWDGHLVFSPTRYSISYELHKPHRVQWALIIMITPQPTYAEVESQCPDVIWTRDSHSCLLLS